MAEAGISNDPTGALDTPKTGIAPVDSQVQTLQAEDAVRKAVAAAQTQAERGDSPASLTGKA